ncbi:DEAD/DEAH box helicase family protein [Pseudomonas sp. N3-W]|uniref:DEAD/DEAH box helicase n=1 Tax=Pseudomonas sp. N3-W TaxID=2975049 RepID=UPI00217EA7C0|nr:DEAD/DEAH box helicase family protein [Pseudomonas sp. N3-W]UWF51824.1 DEAD/DEAH box helicase family protein [Pseudomonas sp. N3-W]
MPLDAGMYKTNDAYRSWIDNPFRFIEPNSSNGDFGLRKPQLAALHMTLGHLISTPDIPATVVMPTGTGKTDTIFSLILAGTFPRTLIIVPSDALREQTAEKIVALKTLRNMKAVVPAVLSPAISKLSSKLTVNEVEKLEQFNVLIATPQALQHFNEEELAALTKLCTHLVIDEAHHVAASTWSRIRKAFAGKPCIQFTATPFREDKEGLDGKIIYNYPLKEAQIDGYFQKIEFHPIREYQPSLADAAIAEKAIALLRVDLDEGKDHLMMVRAKTQKKAKLLFEIYRKFEDLDPVLIHSKSANRAATLENIKRKKHKVIVCVDMLGEGFDLPELKIAAIHDQHRSPAVTLQFIGRLTRVDKKLGNAKFVANIANQKMDSQMSALYKESADWSAVIRDVSAEKIHREVQREELTSQFSDDEDGEKILALNPIPKISAIAYHVEKEDWTPARAAHFKSNKEKLQYSSVNESGDTVILVTKADVSVSWANTFEIHNTEWYLYLAYYRKDDQTLFINCSGDEGQALKFRDLVSSASTKIAGEKTFRTLHNITFLKLQNVGLSRAQKDVRFTMHVGRDINAIMSELENGTAVKSNIFATGFEDGDKTTAGCSHKGKIWEMNSESIDYWVRWCDQAAVKLNDANIDPQNILNNVMRSEQIREAWPTGLFYADWPDSIGIETEAKISITIDGLSYNLLEVYPGQPKRTSDTLIEIPLLTDSDEKYRQQIAIVKINLLEDGYKTICDGAKISLQNERPLAEYLDDNPFRILKQDGSFIFGNYRYYSPVTLNIKMPLKLISAWDWGDTQIQNESMGKDENLDTVQGFTYKKIEDKYQIIFNDDGAGEIADLIGINENDGIITVDFYHCKYCGSKDGVATPGARVTDAYEVSGQTSRSVKWLHSGEALFSQMVSRFSKSIDKGFNRILKGTIDEVDLLRYKCRDNELSVGFFIVQPAISKAKISDEQLTVLGTSYTYIKGISGSDLQVIINN